MKQTKPEPDLENIFEDIEVALTAEKIDLRRSKPDEKFHDSAWSAAIYRSLEIIKEIRGKYGY